MKFKDLLKRIDSYRIPIRERLNPYLGHSRNRKLKNKSFTLFSNNCWGGHVYRYFNLPYNSPTIGLYFYAEDYVRFISNPKFYCSLELKIIDPKESYHYDRLIKQNNQNAVIGKLGEDVEIVFLHYKSGEEAVGKWNRRCARINWDNVIVKFSEQNYATYEHLKCVDELLYDRKVIFTSHDYGLRSQIIFKEYEGCQQIPDETTHFRRYINLIKFINGEQIKKDKI